MRRLLIIVILLATVAVWLAVPSKREMKPVFPEQRPESIDLIIADECVGTVTNTEAVMSVLRQGRSTRPHACTATGWLVLHYNGREDMRVVILPGHSESNYEFVSDTGNFTVPRPAFISALTSEGIDEKKLLTE